MQINAIYAFSSSSFFFFAFPLLSLSLSVYEYLPGYCNQVHTSSVLPDLSCASTR